MGDTGLKGLGFRSFLLIPDRQGSRGPSLGVAFIGWRWKRLGLSDSLDGWIPSAVQECRGILERVVNQPRASEAGVASFMLS